MGTRSAEKAARQAVRRRMRNKAVRSSLKTFVSRAEELLAAKEVETAKESVAAAISALDRAVIKGVVHRNGAARRKSRLMKKLNQAASAPEAQAKGAVAEPAPQKKARASRSRRVVQGSQ